MAILGPAVGYVVGGQLLLFYTDMFIVDSATWVFFFLVIVYNIYRNSLEQ